MMSGNAQFRVVLKISTSAHTTLTAVIVRIGNEKSASRQEITDETRASRYQEPQDRISK
jgi:hypothetical protein